MDNPLWQNYQSRLDSPEGKSARPTQLSPSLRVAPEAFLIGMPHNLGPFTCGP